MVTLIFNLSLSFSIIPISRKHSIVTSPKVHPPRSFDDLQPISVTTILSRVFKKLFMRFLFYHLIPKSYAFFCNVTNFLQTNVFARCFLIDFSKAFDSVIQFYLTN